jgi:hypothetical protein
VYVPGAQPFPETVIGMAGAVADSVTVVDPIPAWLTVTD